MAAEPRTRNVSLRAVLTALLGGVCSQGCSPAEAPAKLSADRSVCTCARNGLHFEEESGVFTVSMTRASLAVLRSSEDFETLLAREDQKHKFQWNRDRELHIASITKDALRHMVEEIWEARTGLSIKVDDIAIGGIIDAIDKAA